MMNDEQPVAQAYPKKRRKGAEKAGMTIA